MGYLTNFVLILFFTITLCYDKLSARRRKYLNNPKIVGGQIKNIKNYPYMACLNTYDGMTYYRCGGSIISPRHVLTAAHCFDEIILVYVRIGSSKCSTGGSAYQSKTFLIHPKYNPHSMPKNDFDVAVVLMNTPMRLNSPLTKIIPLIQGGRSVPSNTQVSVTGWGSLRESDNEPASEVLMGITVPTLTNPRCKQIMSRFIVTNRMFCAGYTQGGKDACQGDSGGPAVSKGTQVGIVSGGYGCARPNVPGFYTNITDKPIRDWIKKTTGV